MKEIVFSAHNDIFYTSQQLIGYINYIQIYKNIPVKEIYTG